MIHPIGPIRLNQSNPLGPFQLMDSLATIGAKAYNTQWCIHIAHTSFVCYRLVVTVDGEFVPK